MDRRKVIGLVAISLAVGFMLLPSDANAWGWRNRGCCGWDYSCCGYGWGGNYSRCCGYGGYYVSYSPCSYAYTDCCNGSAYPATGTVPPSQQQGTGRTSFYYPESQDSSMARVPQAPRPAPGIGDQGMPSGASGQGAIGGNLGTQGQGDIWTQGGNLGTQGNIGSQGGVGLGGSGTGTTGQDPGSVR